MAYKQPHSLNLTKLSLAEFLPFIPSPMPTMATALIDHSTESAIKDRKLTVNRDGKMGIITPRPPQRISFQRADNGPGIPPEVMQIIRDPFFNAKKQVRKDALDLGSGYNMVRILTALQKKIVKGGGTICIATPSLRSVQ